MSSRNTCKVHFSAEVVASHIIDFVKILCGILFQARRHVFKSGPAEVRASAEGTFGTSGREHERGYPPLVRGARHQENMSV